MSKEIGYTKEETDFPYGWNKGDTCVMITNKAKRSTSEYIVESYDGVYFGIRSHTGLYHRVSPWRMFRTKEEAIETLEAYRFRNHSILCWFSNGRKMVFFTIERPEQMCYNGFENVLEDKEEGVTEA